MSILLTVVTVVCLLIAQLSAASQTKVAQMQMHHIPVALTVDDTPSPNSICTGFLREGRLFDIAELVLHSDKDIRSMAVPEQTILCDSIVRSLARHDAQDELLNWAVQQCPQRILSRAAFLGHQHPPPPPPPQQQQQQGESPLVYYLQLHALDEERDSNDDGNSVMSLLSTSSTTTPPLLSMLVPASTRRRATSISRHTEKRGFHRNLLTTIELSPEGPSFEEICLIEYLPPQIYIDEYEINEIIRFAELQQHVPQTTSANNTEITTITSLHLFSPIDLEKPASVSPAHVISVCGRVRSSARSHLVFSMPIHYRYQSPARSCTHRRTCILPPSVLVRNTTSKSILTQIFSSLSDYVLLEFPTDSELEIACADIPVGNLDDGPVVTTVTLIVTVALTVLVSVVSLFVYKPSTHPKQD